MYYCNIFQSGTISTEMGGTVRPKYPQDAEIFTFAGLYSTWNDIQTGEALNSYTILTTEANETMKYVHNMKQRMPVMLKKADEMAGLDHSNPINDFAFPYQANLIALKV